MTNGQGKQIVKAQSTAGQKGRGALLRWAARMAHRFHRLRLWLTRPLTVGVRLLLIRDGQVLLVRHTYHDGWLLPGGGVAKGETLEAAARREAREELGADLGHLALFGVYTNFYEHKSDHVIVFVSHDFELSGAPTDRVEIDCKAFFPLNALPADLLSGHRRRLEEYQQAGRTAACGPW